MYIVNNISYSDFKNLLLNDILYLLKRILFNKKNFEFFFEQFKITYYPSLIKFSSSKPIYYNILGKNNRSITNIISIYIPIKLNIKNNNKNIKFVFNVLNIPKVSTNGYLTLRGIKRTAISSLTSVIKYYSNNNKNETLILYDNTYSIKLNQSQFININLNTIKGIFYKFDFIENINIYYYKYFYVYKKNIKKNINNIYDIFINLEFFKILTNTLSSITLNYNDINYDSLSYKLINNLSDYILKPINNLYYRPLLFFKNSCILKYNNIFSLSECLIKEGLFTHPLIQIVDQTNCISEISHTYKINSSKETIYNKFAIHRNLRLIKGDYITKLSPLSTSEGESAGMISSILCLNTFNNRKLKTLLNLNNKSFKNIKFDSISIYLYKNNFTNKESNNTKKNYNINKHYNINEFGEFKLNKIKNNEYYSNLQNLLSISESIIPFILYNDPCRGIMGSKMHCQALPLVYSDIPYIFTKNNKINKITQNNCLISNTNGIVLSSTKYKIIIQDTNNRIITYYIKPIIVNNYNSSCINNNIVWPGENITYGTILSTNKNYSNLELSLGKNMLVGYCNYYGNDHEDAIIFKKNLIYNDYMLSIKFDIYETYINNYTDSTEIINVNFLTKNKLLLEHSVLIPKIKILINISEKIYTKKNLSFTHYLPITLESTKINSGCSCRIIKTNSKITETNNDNNKKNNFIKINVTTINFNKINVGDKLCGRHGNKGVISCLLDKVNIPYTNFDLIPDILITSISAISRINSGQLLEGSCGYYSFLNKIRLNIPYFINNCKYINSFYSTINTINKQKKFKQYNNNKTFIKNPLIGSSYYNNIPILCSYYLKLSHIVKNKIKFRSIGKYSELTQQPVGNQKNNKGQRFGEMEFWALESHSSSFNLKELSYIKSSKSMYISKLSYSDILNSLSTELTGINLKIINYYNDIIL